MAKAIDLSVSKYGIYLTIEEQGRNKLVANLDLKSLKSLDEQIDKVMIGVEVLMLTGELNGNGEVDIN